ncbi:putative f-box domain-containing protein [Diaporthe ampelina]|uniref:Putative f-box domain-containing protein n=1 Tax=Diaporthe ampelina TaxID=1214573 RepID=A0A0G2HQL0_9PEZI|nr:putative f-box domain-containing protein [Diaporthe ampelina]
MDPPHITEFASKRYFEKINQLPKDQQPQQQHHNDSTVVESSSSRFILPIRGAEQPGHESQARNVEYIKQEKERERERRSLRQSVVTDVSTNSVAEIATARPRSLPFDQLFLNLPNELQIQIIAYLPLSDVLNLRRASKSWHSMVTLNEFPIVRHQLEHEIPAYAKRLYPVSDPSGYTLHHLCGLWHRLHVAAKLSGLMCDWCTKEIFLKTTKDQIASFASQRERMYRRLIPLLFTIFHFFENYRKLHLQYVQHHGHGVERTPYTLNPVEAQIMNILLLPDLPVLQKLWLSTAEAVILDRKIVERSVDIKRNAQVMLDLIKEDGGEGEDFWWYENIQPPKEAIEEDTLE